MRFTQRFEGLKNWVKTELCEGRSMKAPGPLWAFVRVLLLILVVPTIVVSTDGRAAHDRIAGTVQIRM